MTTVHTTPPLADYQKSLPQRQAQIIQNLR